MAADTFGTEEAAKDLLLAAAHELGVPPQQCLAVGFSLEQAKRAAGGMFVEFVAK